MKKPFFKRLFKGKNNPQVGQLKAEAAKGDPEALYQLGLAYSAGSGVTQDYVEAVRQFKAAADKGHTEAQNALGLCFDHGTGVEPDPGQAVQWYAKAADPGLVEAQRVRLSPPPSARLGERKREGCGVAPS